MSNQCTHLYTPTSRLPATDAPLESNRARNWDYKALTQFWKWLR